MTRRGGLNEPALPTMAGRLTWEPPRDVRVPRRASLTRAFRTAPEGATGQGLDRKQATTNPGFQKVIVARAERAVSGGFPTFQPMKLGTAGESVRSGADNAF